MIKFSWVVLFSIAIFLLSVIWYICRNSNNAKERLKRKIDGYPN